MVVIHDRFRETVVTEMGVQPAAVTVVRNWSHLDGPVSFDRAAVRAHLGWDDDDVVVLHSGNMGVKQGLENVILAGRRAQERGSAVRFVLLGDGNQRDVLATAAREVPTVQMLGSVPDEQFRKVLGAADVLLVNERPGVAGMAVPSKLTSYFSTGLPVIAATDPGSVTESEVLLSGGGVAVPAGDPDALLRAAEGLAEDTAGAAAMGRAGMHFRATQLSSEAALETYAQLLARLANGQKASNFREAGNS